MEDIYFEHTDSYSPLESLLSWKLIVGMAGENIFLANHKPYTIKPGSVLLIKPFEYAFPICPSDTFQYRCYTFERLHGAVLHSVALYTYIQLPEQIVQQTCTLFHILAGCTEPQNLLRKTSHTILPPVPQKAVAELQKELPVSVKDWARSIGVSDRTLETHFKQTFNILPGTYLRNAKYCHFTAKKCLVSRHKPCYNIENFS